MYRVSFYSLAFFTFYANSYHSLLDATKLSVLYSDIRISSFYHRLLVTYQQSNKNENDWYLVALVLLICNDFSHYPMAYALPPTNIVNFLVRFLSLRIGFYLTHVLIWKFVSYIILCSVTFFFLISRHFILFYVPSTK